MMSILPPELRHKKTSLAEEQFENLADAKRFVFSRRGWPDYFVQKETGERLFVEVKANLEDPLRQSQVLMFSFLEQAGFSIFVWCPELGDALRPWRSWVTSVRAAKKKSKRRWDDERARIAWRMRGPRLPKGPPKPKPNKTR
jgi:hypothetical protein